MKKAYDKIKKHYGEKFARLCRDNFPELMEDDNFLPELIEAHFAPSRFLYDDLVAGDKVQEFKNYIYSKTDIKKREQHDIVETPEELMDRAGYTLIKCETNDDVQSFKHYWKRGEELCTFRDPYRIETHTIFFAVKKNVDDIRRENFTQPRRQDEYGTSVISIQFTKGSSSTVSIKNRYNHTVSDPDATFSNDLENIYPGLIESFTKYYGINFIHLGYGLELPGYVMANDGRYYKYNYEIDDIYYCPDNIVIKNGQVSRYDKSRYELIDYFLIDKVTKELKDLTIYKDSFVNAFDNGNIKRIQITNINNGVKSIIFTTLDNNIIELTLDKYNRILRYSNDKITTIGDYFLYHNKSLIELNLPAVKNIGRWCLKHNNSLKKFNAPSLTSVGDYFLSNNKSLELEEFNASALTTTGYYFFSSNHLINYSYYIRDKLRKNEDKKKDNTLT